MSLLSTGRRVSYVRCGDGILISQCDGIWPGKDAYRREALQHPSEGRGTRERTGQMCRNTGPRPAGRLLGRRAHSGWGPRDRPRLRRRDVGERPNAYIEIRLDRSRNRSKTSAEVRLGGSDPEAGSYHVRERPNASIEVRLDRSRNGSKTSAEVRLGGSDPEAGTWGPEA